jgi:hypothetical protein
MVQNANLTSVTMLHFPVFQALVFECVRLFFSGDAREFDDVNFRALFQGSVS